MAFDKAAVKAALTALAQSIAVIVQRGTVANATKFSNKTLAEVTDLAIQTAAQRSGQDGSVSLVNFSAPGVPENVYVTGSPSQIRNYMNTNKVSKVVGRATSLVGSMAPSEVRILPRIRNQMAAPGIGDSGLFTVECLGNNNLRRTYVRFFSIVLYGQMHYITFEQYSQGSSWTNWNVVDEGINFTSDEVDGYGNMGEPWPATTIHRKVSQDHVVVFREEQNLYDTGAPEYMHNSLYIFTLVEWSYVYLTISGEAGVTISCDKNKLPKASRPGAVVFARRIAQNHWRIYGDLDNNPNVASTELYTYVKAGVAEPANFDIVHWVSGPDYRAIVDCKDQTVGTLKLPLKSGNENDLDIGFPIGGQIEFMMTANAACVLTISSAEPSYQLVVQSGKAATVSKKNAKFTLMRVSNTKWILSGDGLDNV